jgi:hypothetical protein
MDRYPKKMEQGKVKPARCKLFRLIYPNNIESDRAIAKGEARFRQKAPYLELHKTGLDHIRLHTSITRKSSQIKGKQNYSQKKKERKKTIEARTRQDATNDLARSTLTPDQSSNIALIANAQ